MTAPTPTEIREYINLNIIENGVERVRATHVRTAIRMLTDFAESIDPAIEVPANITAILNGKADKTTTISGAGLATGGGTLGANRSITVTVASQAEAEAGAANDRAMTPLRVKEEVLALAGDPVFAAAFARALMKALPFPADIETASADAAVLNGGMLYLTPEGSTP